METCSDIGVIFDCDGTLLDSMPMWHSLDDRIAQRAGVQLTQADRDYFTQATLRECGDYIHDRYGFGASGAAVEQMIAGEIMHWYADEPVMKPGAADFVRGLAEAAVKAADLKAGFVYAGCIPARRFAECGVGAIHEGHRVGGGCALVEA